MKKQFQHLKLFLIALLLATTLSSTAQQQSPTTPSDSGSQIAKFPPGVLKNCASQRLEPTPDAYRPTTVFARSFYIRFPKITLPCTPRLALNSSHYYNIHRYQSLSSVTLKRHLASEL